MSQVTLRPKLPQDTLSVRALTRGSVLCEIISGVILAEIVKSNHSSTGSDTGGGGGYGG